MSQRVELRGSVDALIIEVTDAICQATGQHRLEVLEPVLLDWARKEIHKSNLVANITKHKAHSSESDWKGGGR